MTTTLDTYSRRTIAYKLTEIFALFLLLHLLILLIFGNKLNGILSGALRQIFLLTFVLSLLGFIAGLLMRTIRSNILMYVKDGELKIHVDKISLDKTTYNLSDISKIEFKIVGYRGQAGSRSGKDGTGNKILVYEKSNQILRKSFVLNTSEELEYLKRILLEWKAAGFMVKVQGFDLT